MSVQRKSRNIVSLPTTHSTKNKDLLNKFQKSFDSFLGEDIKNEPGTPINSLSTTDSDLEGILDLGIKISGLSSSSSISWSEEYESEVGKKVLSELEKLDRIFQGLEEDTSPYDMNEIVEWKRYFPHLYLLGHNTPTNSAENSDASSNLEDEISVEPPQQHTFGHRRVVYPGNRSSVINKRRSDQDVLNPVRNYHSLPRKPKSLDIDQYLKISSIKSPNARKRKQNQQSVPVRQSRELMGDVSPEFTSLPFIPATPLKNQTRQRNERNRPPKMLITLPPIENSFRSISATPRQASSKSLYAPLNYGRNSSKQGSQASTLKSDLMKLFDNIPISNR